MFKYVGKFKNKFNILDTSDNVTDTVTGAELIEYMKKVEIDGLYLNEDGDIEDKWGDVIYSLPKKSKNSNLTKAKKAKNDEFYTQLSDIEKELSHYPPDTFKDKVIYCPMDVATTQGAILRSEFVHYFQMHAHELQFKELIATCLHDKSTGEGYADEDVRSNNYHLKRQTVSYATSENQASGKSPIAEVKNEFGQLCYKYIDGRLEPIPDNVVNECILDTDGNLIIESEGTPQLYHYEGYFFADCKPDDDFDEGDVEGSNKRGSYGSGDFRSKKCLSYLEQCDIVVTNPPFSLFRDFVKCLVDADKKFIIVGNQNAITYKEIYTLIGTEQIWTGSQKGIDSMYFECPSDYNVPDDARKAVERHYSKDQIAGRNMTYLRTTCWFTNVDLQKRHDKLVGLSMQDNIDNGVSYFKYDNYNAIEVGKLKELPIDYDGIMGVPITYLYQHNPDQFEIIRFRKGDDDKDLCVNGKCPYFRILIRHRKDENGKLI